jgi:hypothetical protein
VLLLAFFFFGKRQKDNDGYQQATEVALNLLKEER